MHKNGQCSLSLSLSHVQSLSKQIIFEPIFQKALQVYLFPRSSQSKLTGKVFKCSVKFTRITVERTTSQQRSFQITDVKPPWKILNPPRLLLAIAQQNYLHHRWNWFTKFSKAKPVPYLCDFSIHENFSFAEGFLNMHYKYCFWVFCNSLLHNLKA